MNETRTTSMLQRMPVILAVTANSYGLSLEPREARRPRSADCQRHRRAKAGADSKPMAQR
ncbi:MAG: hypothetical protein ACO1PB_14480 [Ramlibacter sp.]